MRDWCIQAKFHSDPGLHRSGTMLTLFLTFKAKTDRALKKMAYNVGDVVTKGRMDSKLMHEWILKVLVKYTKGRHALLSFDTFKGNIA